MTRVILICRAVTRAVRSSTCGIVYYIEKEIEKKRKTSTETSEIEGSGTVDVTTCENR